jgi:UDP-glucose 4-epimerase
MDNSSALVNVLLTGAAGYLGSMVLRKLYADFADKKIHKLVATDLRPLSADTLAQMTGISFVAADIRDRQAMTNIIAEHQITCIVHLAAIIDSTSLPEQTQYEIDVTATEQLLALAVAHKVQRIIISSSGAAYGYHADNPQWLCESDALRGNDVFLYSRHKRKVEEILADYRRKSPQLQQIVFRVGTILGATTNNLITRLFDRKRILGVRGFASPFVFIWDEDAAQAFRQAVFSDTTGVFNLAADGALPNADIARLMNKSYLALPAFLLRLFLRVGYALRLSQYSADQLLYIQYRPVLNNYHLKEEFGFTPTKTTLQTFCYFLQARGITPQNMDKVQPLMPEG